MVKFKRYSNVFIVVLICALVFSCTKDKVTLVSETIELVGQKYAPDSRTSIYNVYVSGRGGDIVIKGKVTEKIAVEKLKNKLDSLKIDYLEEIQILPTDSMKYRVGLVNNSVGNVRRWTRNSSELSTQVLLGQPVMLLDMDEDWYMVQTIDGYIGWMDTLTIHPLSDDEYQKWKTSDKHYFQKTNGWIYDEANVKSQVVSDVVAGSILIPIGSENQMTKVRLPDGRMGFLPTESVISYSEISELTYIDPDSIVKLAFQYLGVPYLWGGTSPYGFDCSGYTKAVYSHIGFILDRDASQQVKQGMELEVDTTFSIYKPGDLLFFGKKGKTKNFIKHVAIYIGDGKIIHATGRVRVQSLKRSDPDFAKNRFDTWLAARRIANTEHVKKIKTYADLLI